MELGERVRAFVTSNFYVPDPANLSDDVSLTERGIIDSTGVLELIHFIEEELRVVVEDSEMVPENLDSIARVCAFVTRKRRRVA